jgi:hypothetical protein
MMARLASWTMANQLNAKHALDKATVQKMGGQVEMIPPSAFGNTITNITTPPQGSGALLKLVTAGVAALGLGAGGLGLYSLMTHGLASMNPTSSPASLIEDIPLIVDWSLENVGTDPSSAGEQHN